MNEIQKLITVLTEAAIEVRNYYARLNQPELPVAPPLTRVTPFTAHVAETENGAHITTRLSEDVPAHRKERKPRATKAEMAARVASPAVTPTTEAIMADMEAAVVPPVAPAPIPDEIAPPVYAKNIEPELTEEESKAAALATAKVFVQRFQKATPDGLTRARAILANFKVAKIGELDHVQRISFINCLNEAMSSADALVTAGVGE